MTRLLTVIFISLFTLAACEGVTPKMADDGKTVQRIFRIGMGESSKIPFRTLDSINAFRAAKNLQQVELSSALTAAAATHSRDMSVQNRPWHFGSDGSSPLDRVARSGFSGQLLGENISETFESDVETLSAWMLEPATKDAIMHPDATHIGISWFQDPNGKIWWTLIIGG